MPETALMIGLLAAIATLAVLLVTTRRDAAAARVDHAAAISRADLAERDVEHHRERASELAGLHEALDARLHAAREERAEIASREARLAESVDGLARALEVARGERAAIQGKLDHTAGEVTRLTAANERLRTSLDAQQEAHEREVALLRGLRQEMTDRFQALADETLARHGARFGEANQREIKALIEPVREQVQRFQGELDRAHKDAGTERKLLQAEIERLTRSTASISEEATALTRALKGDSRTQGAWGEMLLERILEQAELREGVHYERQAKARSDEGALLRPDVVVRLPGEDKRLVIDSKVSLTAYSQAVAAEDPDEAARHLTAHVASVKGHIDALAGKDYAAAVGGVDYVMMFMPIESALGAAWRARDDLAAYAIEKRIAIVTPTTLLTVLRTVHHVWAVERRNEGAQRIAERAGLLYNKVVSFTESMKRVGLQLAAAQRSYDEAVGQLSTGQGNLLRQVQLLKDEGAKTAKAIDMPFDGNGDEDGDGDRDGDDRAPPAIEAAE